MSAKIQVNQNHPSSAGLHRSSSSANNENQKSRSASKRKEFSSSPKSNTTNQRPAPSHHHHTPPPAGHTFRISISKLLGNQQQSPSRNLLGDNNNFTEIFMSEEEAQAARVVEALFPDASFTIPSPTMRLEREKLLKEQKQHQQQQEQIASLSNSVSLNFPNRKDDAAASLSMSQSQEITSSSKGEHHHQNKSTKTREAVNLSASTNEANKTPAVKRRSSVGSLMMSGATDDLVGVSKPKFRNSSIDINGDPNNNNNDDDGGRRPSSSSARRYSSRRRSSAGSISPLTTTNRRPSSASVSPRGDGSGSGRLFHTIDEESSRWHADDLEVLRLLLRTIHTSSAACPSKRLLPSSGIAARLLLQGTSTHALDAPANAVRARITLGNLRSVLGSQPHFDHIKVNSPRSVTVVLRNGLQCDELIAKISDLLNDRLQNDMQRVEAQQLLAKLEFEYRALCDIISRRDAVEFLLEPTVPEVASRPTQAELSVNFVEATKRRGLMKLARHQHETERTWQVEQERIKKNQAIEERLRLRAEALEARKQQARVQHSMNDLDRNKPVVPYHKQQQRQHQSNEKTNDDDDSSDDENEDANYFTDENGERHLIDPVLKQQRKEERRKQRLIESRFIYSSSRSKNNNRKSSSSPNGAMMTTNERVAKVRAARDAIERRRLIDAHRFEAMRQEQVLDCEARKQDLHRHIAQERAAHNAHVRSAVTATRRSYEYEQIRRIADIEHDEARTIIRREQQHRLKERLREQLRVAQHLDLEAQRVIEKGTVTLGQSLEKMRLTGGGATAVNASAMSSSRSYQTGLLMNHHVPNLWSHQQNAIEESHNAMMRVAQKEANLERKWNSLK